MARQDTPLESIDVSFTDAPSPVESTIAASEPTPTIIATTLGEVEGLLLSEERFDEPPRKLRTNLRKRGVEDLVASFSVSSYDTDGTMKRTQATLLDVLTVTPAPPRTRPAKRLLTRPVVAARSR